MTMNTNRIIELALVFFISIFSFSIGTFVGKKYSDNQHRLALLEPNKKTAERTALEAATQLEATEPTSMNTESEITDADVAKLAEEFSVDTEELQAVSTEDKAAEKTTANASDANSKNTKDIPVIAEQTIVEKDLDDNSDRDIASVPAKTKSMATYTVQVGSYPTEADAEKMTESLLARGYKASSVPATVNGKTMYRVQVGLFNSFNQAQEYKKELIEKNRLSSAFVQKVSK